jgi:hypothetical protein
VGRPRNRCEVAIQKDTGNLYWNRNWEAVARDEKWRKKPGEAMAQKLAKAPYKNKRYL